MGVYQVPYHLNYIDTQHDTDSSSNLDSDVAHTEPRIIFKSHPAFDDTTIKRRKVNPGINHPDEHAKGVMAIRTQGKHKRREETQDYDIRAGLDIEHVTCDLLDS